MVRPLVGRAGVAHVRVVGHGRRVVPGARDPGLRVVDHGLGATGQRGRRERRPGREAARVRDEPGPDDRVAVELGDPVRGREPGRVLDLVDRLEDRLRQPVVGREVDDPDAAVEKGAHVLHRGRVRHGEEREVRVDGVDGRVRERDLREAGQLGVDARERGAVVPPRGRDGHLGRGVGGEQADQVPARVPRGPDDGDLHAHISERSRFKGIALPDDLRDREFEDVLGAGRLQTAGSAGSPRTSARPSRPRSSRSRRAPRPSAA